MSLSTSSSTSDTKTANNKKTTPHITLQLPSTLLFSKQKNETNFALLYRSPIRLDPLENAKDQI